MLKIRDDEGILWVWNPVEGRIFCNDAVADGGYYATDFEDAVRKLNEFGYITDDEDADDVYTDEED